MPRRRSAPALRLLPRRRSAPPLRSSPRRRSAPARHEGGARQHAGHRREGGPPPQHSAPFGEAAAPPSSRCVSCCGCAHSSRQRPARRRRPASPSSAAAPAARSPSSSRTSTPCITSSLHRCFYSFACCMILRLSHSISLVSASYHTLQPTNFIQRTLRC
jgi:hypothetical protein